VEPTRLDRVLRPLHRWVWSDPTRRAKKLLRFAETEADGGRDLARAAELTSDGVLRRLYLRHARDEQRHAELFRKRGSDILHETRNDRKRGASFEANWIAPGERGLDDLRVEREREEDLLAFLHLSEKAAAGRFALYREVLACDPVTRDVLTDVLRDEAFHMTYTHRQLCRVAPKRSGARLWKARLGRLWKGYLRIAMGVASVIGTIVLTAQYFIVLPLFAVFAKRAARKEPLGFRQVPPAGR
jgi:hypothetical protein